jgi:hypothetical protein
LPLACCLTTLVRVLKAFNGGSSIIRAIAAAGVLREGKNTVNYVWEEESEKEAGLRGYKDKILLVKI